MATHSDSHSDALKMEQVITESFAKTLHIVLESRSPSASSRHFGERVQASPSSSSSSSSSSVRPRDKWFNLALKECPTSLENLDLWRQSNLEFVIVDILLLHKKLDRIIPSSPKKQIGVGRPHFSWGSKLEEIHAYDKSEKILERWIVKYEKKKEGECGSTSKRLINSLQNCYKKLVILMRSLYATLRLLPANRLIQELSSSGEIRAYTVTNRVSSFVEPFTRSEEAEMQEFSFSPVLTLGGKFSLSVRYRSSLSDLCTDSSAPLSPKFIPDYVGSPLAYPLKRFPSFPTSRVSPMQFLRRHSWTFDRFRASSPSSSALPSRKPSQPRQFPQTFDGDSPFYRSDVLRSESAPVNTSMARQQLLSTARMDAKITPPCQLAIGKSLDLDEVEISCPFDEEEEQGAVNEEWVCRWRLIEAGGGESRDTAVGVLVNMLKKATPLDRFRADETRPKTMADALEELRSYRQINNALPSSTHPL